jgi:hypothetical protein
MNVLRGISPRLFSICLNNDIGKVIPSFSVLSAAVVLTIPIYLIILSYKAGRSKGSIERFRSN